MRRLFIVCLLVCMVAVGCTSTKGEAACVTTHFFLEAEPPRVAPGESFLLRGGPFYVGCHDTGQGRPEPPDQDVRISFKQGDQRWHLGSVAAAGEKHDYTFEAALEVPSAAKPGRAAVVSAAGANGTAKDRIRVIERNSG